MVTLTVYKKKKNDYTCIAFMPDGSIFKMQYVHNIFAFSQWLIIKGYDYKYINIYLRRQPSPNYLLRHYRGNFIIPYP
jgi:DNA gyrase/topoisomerase IV subunit B